MNPLFGKKMKHARERKGLSYRDLSTDLEEYIRSRKNFKALSISESTLKRYESGDIGKGKEERFAELYVEYFKFKRISKNDYLDPRVLEQDFIDKLEDYKWDYDPISFFLDMLCTDLGRWKGLGLNQSIPLADIYITRYLLGSSRPLSDKDFIDRLGEASEAATASRLLISSGAGTGKTFLLRNWALDLVEKATHEAGPVPIYIPLVWANHFLNEYGWQTSLSELTSIIYPDAAGKPFIDLARVLNHKLESARAIILLDGADEVQGDSWEKLHYWINQACRGLMNCPLILSSRPNHSLDLPSNFSTYHLKEWEQKEQIAFIEKWIKATDHAPNKANILIKSLLDAPRLQTPVLAGNPLFLTMMCVEYERFNHISVQPALLFDRYVRILLDEWRPNLIYKMRFSLDLKLRILEQCANHFFELEFVRFPYRNLLECCGKLLEKEPGNLSPEDVITEIEKGSGLLLRDRFGFVQFKHLLFQEFFTARHIINTLSADEQKHWLEEHLCLENPRYERVNQFCFELLSGIGAVD